jgi:hypothetical protein
MPAASVQITTAIKTTNRLRAAIELTFSPKPTINEIPMDASMTGSICDSLL